jgi:hypothetical protein
MLNRSGKSQNSCLLTDHNFFLLRMIFAMSLSHMAFINWDIFFLFLICVEFYHERILNFVKCSLYIYWDDCISSPFSLLMWYVTFIDQYILNHLCFSLVMMNDSFNVLLNSVCWYFIDELCFCVHKGYWPGTFFSWCVFVWLWYQGNVSFIKWVWKYSLFNFVEGLGRTDISSSLNDW